MSRKSNLRILNSYNKDKDVMFSQMLAFFPKIFFNIYSFLRDTDSMSRGGGRERETESEAGSRLWAVSTEPSVGLKLTNHEVMTWAEVGHLTDWTTQAPNKCLFLIFTQVDSLK